MAEVVQDRFGGFVGGRGHGGDSGNGTKKIEVDVGTHK